MDQSSSLKRRTLNDRSADTFARRFLKILGSFAASIAIVSLLQAIFAATTSAQSKSKSWLNGSWEGTGYQTDTKTTWTMSLRVRDGKFLIEYPSLNCGGVWRLLDLDSRSARFKEILKSGASDCANMIQSTRQDPEVCFPWTPGNLKQ